MESFAPGTIKRLAKEWTQICNEPPDGYTPKNTEVLTHLSVTLKGPAQTPYEGGDFEISMQIPLDYPEKPPSAKFVNKIFHPNVSQSGEICLNVLKKDWKKEMGLKDLLICIKCLLIEPNPESALNEEAGRLLIEDYQDYCKQAKLMTEIYAMKNVPKPQPNGSPVKKKPVAKTMKRL